MSSTTSSFSLTHVEYARGDAVGFLCAGMSLAPVFLIVALVTAALARRDAHIAVALLGQLLNTAWNVMLKRLLRQPRPPFLHRGASPAAVGFSPHGMPSNHSQVVFFFAMYWCTYLIYNSNNRPAYRRGENDAQSLPPSRQPGHLCHSVVRPVAVVAIPICAALVSWGRVYLTYHTPAQVIVGALVGAATGLVWYVVTWKFIAPTFFPRIEASYIGRGLGILDATGGGIRQDVVLWEYEQLCANDSAKEQ